MWAHLYTKSADPPRDYLELYLCRDVYHCTPDVLDKQNAVRVYKHLQVMKSEQDIEDFKDRKVKKSKNNRNA